MKLILESAKKLSQFQEKKNNSVSLQNIVLGASPTEIYFDCNLSLS